MSSNAPDPGMPPAGRPASAQQGPGPAWTPQGQPPQGAPQQQWGAPGYAAAAVGEADTRVTGRRVIQYIIDSILAGIIPGLAYWLLDRGSGVANALGWLLATVIAVAVYYWYWVVRPYGHHGQTFGMQLFDLHVISKNGGPASLAQLLIRGILLIVDTIFLGLVGLITMLSSRYRQRVGDHAAGTLVVPAGLIAR